MKGALDIHWLRLATLLVLLALVFLVSARMRLDLGKKIGLAALRGSIQLVAVGYALTAVFSIHNPLLVLATLGLMLSVAARTAASRISRRFRGVAWLAALGLIVGTSVSLGFSTAVVVDIHPWYSPQYLIPIGGMLLGNSMNGVSLAAERFMEELDVRRAEVETLLSLGFSGPEALHPLLKRSLRAAMIPTLNSLTVAGVVQLPGMMTGQILGGVSPLVAVKYQLLIYVALTTSVSLATLVFLLVLRNRQLTAAHQLIPPPEPKPVASRGGGGGGGGGRRHREA
ncbi:MAG: iron export ABC transporter permease subunit FetB [Polyangiaceae bacterium]|nr:iron export ABC transporter permease subunit FetB [Myxococcales bacterium]MCB9585956.1 iron export ABC transporter permease subunit FetB [Polyangiaceae bacterium]MCB9607114.1 iron export ABC transporter permease subunit FetB [Polyangiaceae bacterium]